MRYPAPRVRAAPRLACLCLALVPLRHRFEFLNSAAHFSKIPLDHQHHGWREIAFAHHEIGDFLDALDPLLHRIPAQCLCQPREPPTHLRPASSQLLHERLFLRELAKHLFRLNGSPPLDIFK